MIKDYLSSAEKIRQAMEHYIREHRIQSLVLGQSGGIDSALCSALAYPVCCKLGIPLISRSITIVTNKPDEISRAAAMGQFFSSDFREVDLSSFYQPLAQHLDPEEALPSETDYERRVRTGNLKVRMRMMYLYNLAQKHKGMVLSTDNYTEYQLGFWTLHGDVGDYGPIQMLWKTEVFGMARALASSLESEEAARALMACVDAVPTDGLGITSSDLEQIGTSSYEEVDRILIRHLLGLEQATDAETQKVLARNRRSEFKRSNPYNLRREVFTSDPLLEL
jgi:NAD+ synthetase